MIVDRVSYVLHLYRQFLCDCTATPHRHTCSHRRFAYAMQCTAVDTEACGLQVGYSSWTHPLEFLIPSCAPLPPGNVSLQSVSTHTLPRRTRRHVVVVTWDPPAQLHSPALVGYEVRETGRQAGREGGRAHTHLTTHLTTHPCAYTHARQRALTNPHTRPHTHPH